VDAKPGAPLAPAELRVKIRDRIGAIGAPDAVLQLPELPRRTDGTVDEHKLAAQLKQAASARRHAEPRTEAERAVAKVWKEALNLPQVGLADNFFELGGHSLLAVQVTLKLEEQAGLRIDPRSLFFQTLEQVAKGADATAKTS
jgi:acyl carrier protein